MFVQEDRHREARTHSIFAPKTLNEVESAQFEKDTWKTERDHIDSSNWY